ncbi:hypothetical protein ACFQU2_19715 [Siccirubricoccus deserti]|uniref:Uncharacterized protein n=1 Tax=Siccirubricoccus deserti TaxID=2013562 RepID=A0A9X0R5P5_9PROT|nr:hypothetical protein [Siccirubricoccus deserti]
MAKAEKIDRGFLGKMLRLTLLAPDMVEAILNGSQSIELGITRLMGPFPNRWDEQRAVIVACRP